MEVYPKFFKYEKYKEGLEYLKGKKEERYILAQAFKTGGLGLPKDKCVYKLLIRECTSFLIDSSKIDLMEEAEKNDVFAQLLLYEKEWLLRAAENGLAKAQYIVYTNFFYNMGNVYWLKRAADQCYHDACIDIADYYVFGGNYKMASYYLLKGKCTTAILLRLKFRVAEEIYWYGKAHFKKKIDLDVSNFNLRTYVQSTKDFYLTTAKKTRNALYAWLIVAGKMGIIRDIQILIGENIIELEEAWIKN